ncbi:MAG: hypothetical protein Kow0092_05820 [Deferrisomatales bacterium]
MKRASSTGNVCSRDRDTDRILLRIRQLTRGIDQHSRSLIRDWGVTVPQLLCLRTVAERGPLTSGALAKAINLNRSTVSGIVDRLEKRGLLSRERSTEDRRVVRLSATPSALELLDRAPTLLQERFIARLNQLSPEKLAGIVQSLDFLADLLDVEELEVDTILENPPRF